MSDHQDLNPFSRWPTEMALTGWGLFALVLVVALIRSSVHSDDIERLEGQLTQLTVAAEASDTRLRESLSERQELSELHAETLRDLKQTRKWKDETSAELEQVRAQLKSATLVGAAKPGPARKMAILWGIASDGVLEVPKINLWSKPGLSKILNTQPHGTPSIITDGPRWHVDVNYWRVLPTNGTPEGWVSERLLQIRD